MFGNNILFDYNWDVDKYKSNYDPEYWDLCRTFMEVHKTKYPQQKLAHLTEAFYQIGVYGSSYDAKTTRMVSALAVEVLDDFLVTHPGALKHPFIRTGVVVPEIIDMTKEDESPEEDDSVSKKMQPSSIWDVQIDTSIMVNVLESQHLQALFKGFVIIYDVKKTSFMNDDKVSILEESFRRSKFGSLHWDKKDTLNTFCPIWMDLKWKGTVLAEAVGSDENALRIRLAQAVLSKIAAFSHGIEAKWIYYRNGKLPDMFHNPNPKRSHIYKILLHSQFKGMAEITTYIDTFANSTHSFAEIVFGMDFGTLEKKQIIEHITKSWSTRLTYRTVSKIGVKSKIQTHVCVYHIHTGDELKRWLEQYGENERYRIVPPKEHRRAGTCDSNVREMLKPNSVEYATKSDQDNNLLAVDSTNENSGEKPKNKEEEEKNKKGKEEEERKRKEAEEVIKEKLKQSIENCEELSGDNLKKCLNGFVLFYDAKKNSEIDKDDWFSALRESFNLSKFGPIEVLSDELRPMRTRCVFKWNNKLLASAEGLTETQAKTAATLQLISKLEPFTYIIQAKEEYFFGGKVPPFIECPDPSKSHIYRVVRRQDLPSYYTIFQTIDEFVNVPSNGELVFGVDFTWDLKNEIVVYIKAKGLDYRYFTVGDQKPWTHMAVYHVVSPEDLKNHLLSNGGENEKYKLIPPTNAELIPNKTAEVEVIKVSEKPVPGPSPPGKVVEKRKQPVKEPSLAEEPEGNKIQINLKKFKLDKVEYPEDTGGDFPGLILWLGIKKNSVWQKSLFLILMESFKMSKYGQLVVEEDDEIVWGRKEPLKKCVIKANRKVLAVGLGESKAEAKNSASLQVLRQLRKHCYTIQAKESYFKEGKATPYNFEPESGKENVYRLAKRSKFKDRHAILKFVDVFSKTACNHEVIFGNDFTYDEREAILFHCRLINLPYRLMKCQSTGKAMHSHIAIYHQKPLPTIKAALMNAGGENDMFRLIPPGAKITTQSNQADMWPESLEIASEETSVEPTTAHQSSVTSQLNSALPSTVTKSSPSQQTPVIRPNSKSSLNPNIVKLGPPSNTTERAIPTVPITDRNKPKKIIFQKEENTNVVSNDLGREVMQNQPLYGVPHPETMKLNVSRPISMAMFPQEVKYPEVPYGPQPPFMTPIAVFGQQPHPDMPLSFGPQVQPVAFVPVQQHSIESVKPDCVQVQQEGLPTYNPEVSNSVATTSPKAKGIDKETDLRQELSKKRLGENISKKTSERKVYDLSTERKIIKTDNEDRDGWLRKVFVTESEESEVKNQRSRGKPPDLREKLIRRDSSKDRVHRSSEERIKQRASPDRQRVVTDRREKSPRSDRQAILPERTRTKHLERERYRSPVSNEEIKRTKYRDEERIVREKESTSHEPVRDVNRYSSTSKTGRRRSQSPRKYRDDRRYYRAPSPVMRFRDLWKNIAEELSQEIVMYKYVKQDSTTETDPIALLRATRSLNFNVDFDFIRLKVAVDKWKVCVELVTDYTSTKPLVGEGMAVTEEEARLMAAHHAVDTVQRTCRIIEPNFHYFAEGGVPEFISRRNPMKSYLYEIIQNMDPDNPIDKHTVGVMFRMFLSSKIEDIFFLATDFSYLERMLVIEVATQMNLWWRLFGPRHPDAQSDDIVSTQHVCVFKQKTALQLFKELLDNGGASEKYTLVDHRESHMTRSGEMRQLREDTSPDIAERRKRRHSLERILNGGDKINDCHYFYNGTCLRGDKCFYRHEEAAIGCEKVCENWMAKACFDTHCKFRHMLLDNEPSKIFCFFETQRNGCMKSNCKFKHKRSS